LYTFNPVPCVWLPLELDGWLPVTLLLQLYVYDIWGEPTADPKSSAATCMSTLVEAGLVVVIEMLFDPGQ
jgi:hypothetical protein